MENNSNSTGKLLIAGDGKYNLGSLIRWGFSILADIALLVIGFGVIPDMIADAQRQRNFSHFDIAGERLSIADMESIATIVVVVGVIGLIVGIIFAALALRRFQSEIRVYERCIMGKNIQGFEPTVKEFNVPMADVMNVDVLKETGIVVRTQYGTYTSYTKQAKEIRDIIMANLG